MLSQNLFKKLVLQGRTIELSQTGDDVLGALQLLPGTWSNTPNLPGRGWNFIALPFVSKDPTQNVDYRLLMNQYNEELKFTIVDKAVPNRGIEDQGDGTFKNHDQFLVTLDYVQQVKQIASDDFPASGLTGKPGAAIHHEPGLFLLIANDTVTEDLQLARLASVPHGNSVLAMGTVKKYDGAPQIPVINGLPIGITDTIDSKYMAPYKHFIDAPFKNVFNPQHPNDLLREANENIKIVRTTELHFDTRLGTGGINNIPFIKRQADASEMSVTYWIQELAEKDVNGNPKLRIQYSQTVFLDFFPRNDGKPGLIKWPHVSINTMEKIEETAAGHAE